MLHRFAFLSDRVGRLLAKVVVASSDQVAARFAARPKLTGKSDTAETQEPLREKRIQSLSGFVVLLLGAVVTLALWAVESEGAGSPIVGLLSLGGASERGVAPGLGQSSAPRLSGADPFTLEADTNLIFSMYTGARLEDGTLRAQQDLFLLQAGETIPRRLTDDPADDTYPAVSPDNARVAFASQRGGSWDLYILTLTNGAVERLTSDLAYESEPSWSPDGQWLAYSRYVDGNLDIYIIRADGSEGPYAVTRHPAPDFEPAWTTAPEGRVLAFTSLRAGLQDIYIISLDNPNDAEAINLTATANVAESQPAWNNDGTQLAYTAQENGTRLIYTRDIAAPDQPPQAVAQGSSPAWSPSGDALVFLTAREQGSLLLSGKPGDWSASVRAYTLAGYASHVDWGAAAVPDVPSGSLAFAATAPMLPIYEETIQLPPETESQPYRLINLDDVTAEAAYLSDRVDDSFAALRTQINYAAGWDVLGRLDSVWWPTNQAPEPGQDNLNWHKAGRAIALVQAYNRDADPPQIEVVRVDSNSQTTWEVYVRASVQDGSLGQPLRAIPWDFAARTSGEIEAYEAGGRLKAVIPAGYYVNFTELARLYGWQPTAADESWRSNWGGILFWQYEKRDGLDWWTAMRELYSAEDLDRAFATPTPAPTPTPEPTDEQDEEAEG